MRKMLASFAPMAALLLAPAAASADAPVRGDTERGGRLFRMECASCHGADGGGSTYWQQASQGKNLGNLPDLRDSAFLAQRSDGDLRKAIRKGMGRNGWIPGHSFASALSTLETWDIVQWLRDGSLTVTQFFPDAAKFTAKDFQIDQWGAERLAENLNLKLSQKELEVVVLTVYKGQRDDDDVRLVPWKPVELDLLKAADRLGYLSFQMMDVPGGERIRVGLGIGTDGKLQRVVVTHPDAKKKAEYEKALSAFVGQGQKGASVYKAPRGLKNGDAWAKALTRAAAISAEGITMYEKSERSRTAFDR
ncbi:c-type cytochrome [Vulgatibacter sp.]|uniref:c-type cytochrome n=1 Tax=Vulgatibacter sp. TaxID=1971226 RepID=UPI003569DC2C